MYFLYYVVHNYVIKKLTIIIVNLNQKILTNNKHNTYKQPNKLKIVYLQILYLISFTKFYLVFSIVLNNHFE